MPEEFNHFDHDRKTRAIDTFQIVDADSSQQDAILYAKKGVSFVLQGPPGTGKSQTITNIIAESLAEGKRVLFVSEKMAALEVVHKRLTQAGLSDFCLTLHSHRANKKEVLNDLGNTLALNRFKVHDEAISQLELLEKQRDKLNQYITELHTTIQLSIKHYTE
ncbi:AAA domain-containing protein [Cohnella faecalis]|uniref:AAA domain-containing protein n=1 Tax=Cohnella faecalis TaxID=2315694 RepID=UPI001F3DEE00|nr:AAA domain-containing protein [Cohnella faecalis]